MSAAVRLPPGCLTVGIEFPLSYSPATPNSNTAGSVCDVPASPRACALSALNKRLGALGGWVGSSSNLASSISRCDSSPSTITASLASSALQPPRSPSPCRGNNAGKFGVEGSLDSVTAYSRDHPVHAPAGLHGRKVQGLAEMREGSVTAPLNLNLNGLRRPLKAIFVPPREVRESEVLAALCEREWCLLCVISSCVFVDCHKSLAAAKRWQHPNTHLMSRVQLADCSACL